MIISILTIIIVMIIIIITITIIIVIIIIIIIIDSWGSWERRVARSAALGNSQSPLQTGGFKWGEPCLFVWWGGAPAQKEPWSSCEGPRP